MVIEDDMVACDETVVARILDVVHRVNTQSHDTWNMIRVGFGGNGVILKAKDLTMAGLALIQSMDRRPVDWIFPEWAGMITLQSRVEHPSKKPRVFTFKSNLFHHIGILSNFQADGRGFRGTRNEDSRLPGCFKDNVFLRQEEAFDFKRCRHTDISPCM